MLATFVCIAAFAGTLRAGLFSRRAGLAAVIITGYFYGIVRANIPGGASHFIFDAACAGLYAGVFAHRLSVEDKFRLSGLMPWILVLASWPLMLFLIPIQHPLIQLVGLRGQIFFLPFLLLGALLDRDDAHWLAMVFAVLSFVALGFGLAEVEFGVPRFYPRSDVTELLYRSADVKVGGSHQFRIPSVFVNSTGYGGMMTLALPLVLGSYVELAGGGWRRGLLACSAGVSGIGVFLCASRLQAVLFVSMVLASSWLMLRVKQPHRVRLRSLALISAAVVILAATQPRLQRFVTLVDSDYVEDRLHWSMNDTFWTLVQEYPMGNGLGGGGTSIPYFLEDMIQDPVKMENEYARIELELGIPGLLIWLAFLIWIVTRAAPRQEQSWWLGRCLARVAFASAFAAGGIGTGLLSSIPGTPVLFLYAGWTAAPWVERRQGRVIAKPARIASGFPVSHGA